MDMDMDMGLTLYFLTRVVSIQNKLLQHMQIQFLNIFLKLHIFNFIYNFFFSFAFI